MHIVQFDPSKFNHQHVICGGYSYHYVDEGNKAGIAVILIHGFPDLWYGWRHQIQFLVGLGRYRVIALDMLGYGGSDKPRSADLATDTDPTECHYHHNPAYSPRNVASHVVALLDHLGVEKTVLVGHDWGTGIVSRVGWHFPDRVLAAIAIGNPFRPITKELMTINDYVNENPAFQYFEHFVSPEAVQDFDERVGCLYRFLLLCVSMPSTYDIMIPGRMLHDRSKILPMNSYYLSSLKRGGFHGPLAYYKTFKASHQEEQCISLLYHSFAIPTLLLIVNNDPILHPEYCLQVPKDYFDNLEIDYVETGEHWILTQNPDTVNRKLERYLGKISSSFDYQARKSTPSIKSTIGSLVRRRTSAVLRIPAVAAGETDFKNWSSVPGGSSSSAKRIRATEHGHILSKL
ncbi:Alpha/Beta hydrolase protein [Gamsiella multidivaricata]|uniref:Alpha/Beta hydrolase protein n=1 Tax=Gamsiella multidivaricata TaxID=101098 RepID=UPI0022201B30|nr:Alpha/Beta hydrolase protein [Gamsiella multidivaricata]KAI7818667.1 Alpha/Beta hydrolase protein [Gamsiella multidivaricata]